MINAALFLPSFYLPPASYFAKLLNSDGPVFIDIYENYERQTFRNRCEIATPNGRLALVIPVRKQPGKVPMNEIEIAYDEKWQQRHWRSICNHYRKSAYFEYYEDQFSKFYSSNEYKYLIDWNKALLDHTLKILKTNVAYSFTEKFENKNEQIKEEGKELTGKYFQLFEHQTGFLKDLSIIDLIFNSGPTSVRLLQINKI